ncbi:MAG: quinone-dependent dihydroorotate dehydrogenase [Proteobacteria bacterium]|nr:quinone-dependent dihydroorotate dehydrogenase [Pseudomonadota bacterium]
MFMFSIIRYLLFLFDPEIAHHIAMKSLKVADFFGLLSFLPSPAPSKPRVVFGIEFKNALGLAAGLDKNAEYIDCLSKLGFGFIEVGTLTPRAQPGNPKPRLFRLTNEEGIINRFGFNNVGIDKAILNIKSSKFTGVLGINIGKNFDTPIEEAINDYLLCFRKAYQYASYIVINISSPNTQNLRKLQDESFFEGLISRIKLEQETQARKHKKYVPFLIKISPDGSMKEMDNIIKLLIKYNIDGIIATNTTLSRDEVSKSKFKDQAGGLSGEPLRSRALKTQKYLYKGLKGKIPIIGVGGIMQGKDAVERMDEGAELIQIYSGLIFKGYRLINELCECTKQRQ